MKTALARRNEWMRQLKRLRDERNRRVEDEPEARFTNTVKDTLRSDKLSRIVYEKRR
jgi:hypothetical protein